MSVPELQRIERPLDQFYSSRIGVVTLREFQQSANTSVLVSGHHADHVRMKIDRSLVYRCECQRETDGFVLIEGEQNLSAAFSGDNKNLIWHCVDFRVAPD